MVYPWAALTVAVQPYPHHPQFVLPLFMYDSHLEYVFDCLRKNTTKIRNIRAYLLTALYNAPATINNYYQAEVQHDFGP